MLSQQLQPIRHIQMSILVEQLTLGFLHREEAVMKFVRMMLSIQCMI